MNETFSDPESGSAVTRRDVVGAMVAAPAALALPGMASAAGSAALARGVKLLSIVSRKAELSQDRFRQHWLGIHGPMARTVPGINGFILSEAVADSGARAPGATYSERFDGIAHIWYPAQSALRAGMATSQAKDWLADGDLFIDRKASRGYFVTEQSVIAAPRAEGGIKRTSLLVRKPGITHAEFMAHWTGKHAEMARAVPGLIGCVYNRIDGALGKEASPWVEIDGIAEFWWDSGALNLGGRVESPQWQAWSAEGDRFIDRAQSRTMISLEHVMI